MRVRSHQPYRDDTTIPLLPRRLFPICGEKAGDDITIPPRGDVTIPPPWFSYLLLVNTWSLGYSIESSPRDRVQTNPPEYGTVHCEGSKPLEPLEPLTLTPTLTPGTDPGDCICFWLVRIVG